MGVLSRRRGPVEGLALVHLMVGKGNRVEGEGLMLRSSINGLGKRLECTLMLKNSVNDR